MPGRRPRPAGDGGEVDAVAIARRVREVVAEVRAVDLGARRRRGAAGPRASPRSSAAPERGLLLDLLLTLLLLLSLISLLHILLYILFLFLLLEI